MVVLQSDQEDTPPDPVNLASIQRAEAFLNARFDSPEPVQPSYPYEFRPAARQNQILDVHTVDQDISGNYDPKVSLKKRRRSEKAKDGVPKRRKIQGKCTLEPLESIEKDDDSSAGGTRADEFGLSNQGSPGQSHPDKGSLKDSNPRLNARVITTRLSRPIHFNYDLPGGNSNAKCNWCLETIYGLLGYPAKEVSVMIPRKGQSYVEVALDLHQKAILQASCVPIALPNVCKSWLARTKLSATKVMTVPATSPNWNGWKKAGQIVHLSPGARLPADVNP